MFFSKKTMASFFSLTIISWQSIAQIDYLGQKPPGMKAEVFAPGIVSTNLYEHSAPAFSPDGKLVLWTVVAPTFHSYLLEMKYENGQWSKPAKPSFCDTTVDDYYPSFSPDGKKLYFSSRRKLPKGYPEGNTIRIWEIERTESGWGTPLLFDTTIARGEDYAHSIAANGNFYFSSSLGGGANFGIRKSERVNGKYAAPVLLPFNINSVGYDDGPFIAPDESFLIFESDRPEAFVGLYISFKQEGGSWGIPVNMGPEINSGEGERFGRVSPDGKYFFFGSARDTSGGKIGADIYWIDARIIDELRKDEKAKQKIQQPLGDKLIKALNENDTTNSAGLLKQWLSLYPNSLDAIVIYSSVLRKQKRYSDLEKVLNNAGSEWKQNASIIIEKALVKFGLGKKQEAIELLAPVITTGEPMQQRYFYLSNSLLDMEKFDWSDEYFEKAMAINAHGVFWYNRACGYTHIGQKDRAFAALDKALALGFSDKKQYTEDIDLIPLQTDKRWQQLLLKLK
jgi:hypothetical protein